MDDQPILLKAEQAAKLLNLSRSKFYELATADEVPGVVRIGRSVRISRAALERWVRDRAGDPAPRPAAGDAPPRRARGRHRRRRGAPARPGPDRREHPRRLDEPGRTDRRRPRLAPHQARRGRGRCPCHDSASGTSLVVWDAKDDGGEPKAGIHDFGGCDAARILGAAGLDAGPPLRPDLGPARAHRRRSAGQGTPSSDRPPRPIGTIRHTLRNEAGEVVAVHARTTFDDGTKRVWWERPNGTKGLGGTKIADLPLYGVHEVNGAAEVVLCEGETARDALAGIGVAAVGTVTGAEGTPSEAALRPLLKIPRVRLWPDNDQPGRGHMDSIAARLVAMGHPDVRVIGWTDVPPKADAADLIAGGGTIDDVRRLMAAAAAAGTVAAAELLDRVEAFLGRFVAYPSKHARGPHALDRARAPDGRLGVDAAPGVPVAGAGVRQDAGA